MAVNSSLSRNKIMEAYRRMGNRLHHLEKEGNIADQFLILVNLTSLYTLPHGGEAKVSHPCYVFYSEMNK